VMSGSWIATSVAGITLALAHASKGEDGSTQVLAKELVESCVTFVRSHDRPPTPYEAMISGFEVEALIPQVEAVLESEPRSYRREMLDWFGMMGLGSRNPSIRQRVVNGLLAQLSKKEVDKGLFGLSVEHLISFDAADFSKAARALLSKRLTTGRSNPYVLRKTILLVGIADMKSEIPGLPAPPPLNYRYDRASRALPAWQAVKARARMGVKEDIGRCIEIVSSQPDPKWRVILGFSELKYVAQPEIVEYLRTQLASEELFVPIGWEELCRKRGRARTAGFAASVLGDMVRGFPVRKDMTAGYTEEDLAQCREWMARQKNYDIVKTEVPARIKPVRHRPTQGQANEFEGLFIGKLLKTYADCGRDGQRGQTEALLARALGSDLVTHIAKFRKDRNATVRYFVTKVLGSIGKSPSTPSTRRQIVEILAGTLGDSGGKWPPNAAASVDLLKMTADDFSDAAKAELQRQFADGPSSPRLLVNLILVMLLADARPELSALGDIVNNEAAVPGDEEWWISPGWAAMRARAGFGVPEDMARCIKLVEAEPSRDRRLAMRFHDLVCVRRPEVVKLFIRHLMEDEDVPSWKASQSQYAAHYLGQMVRSFPVKRRSPIKYSHEDIAASREWVAAQDSFDIIGVSVPSEILAVPASGFPEKEADPHVGGQSPIMPAPQPSRQTPKTLG